MAKGGSRATGLGESASEGRRQSYGQRREAPSIKEARRVSEGGAHSTLGASPGRAAAASAHPHPRVDSSQPLLVRVGAPAPSLYFLTAWCPFDCVIPASRAGVSAGDK